MNDTMGFGADGHGAACHPNARSGAGSLGRGGTVVAQQLIAGHHVNAHPAVDDPLPASFAGGTGTDVRGLNGPDNDQRAAKRLRFNDDDQENQQPGARWTHAGADDGPAASDGGDGGAGSGEGYLGGADHGLLAVDSPWTDPGQELDELQYHEHDGGDVGGRGGSRAWHGLEGLSDEEPPSSGEWEEADEAGGSDTDADHRSEDPEEDGGGGDPLISGRGDAHVAHAAAGPSAAARSVPDVTRDLGGSGRWTLLAEGACQVPTAARKWFGAAPAVGSSRAVPVYGRMADGSQTGPYTVQLGSDWQLTGMGELGRDLGAGEGYRLWMAWEMVKGAGTGAAGGTFGVVFANGGPGPAEAGEAAAAAGPSVGGAASGAMRSAAAAVESRENQMGGVGDRRGRSAQGGSQGAGQKR